MTPAPSCCVVDTNVIVVANGGNTEASPVCVAASATALGAVMSQRGRLFVDDGRLIVEEYCRNALGQGEPGPGDAFVKWVLQNEWNPGRVSRVRLTPSSAPEQFREAPPAPPGIAFDPSDCKFLAVANGHSPKPPIIQATDSKWWGWREALASAGVRIHFLCEAEISAKYAEKMGT